MRLLLLIAATLAAQDQPTPDELQKTARAAYSKGDYAAARLALEQAWQLLQTTPQDDPKRYDVLKQLSTTLSAAGDYAAAQNYVELAINWRENIDRNDPKLAEEYIELATLCQRQKNFARALELLGASLRIHSRQGAPNLLMADDL